MGLGNGNPKSGDKGSNFNYELKVLQGLQCTCDQLKIIDGNTDDVEFILTSILTTLQASTEYEAKFTVDTCNGDTVYLEVRVWNPDTSTWGPITYYLPGSTTPVIPPGAATPGCLVYADPSAVLALILGAIQASNVILTDIETSVELIDNCVGTDGATAPANSFVIAGVTAGGIQQTVEVNASGHVNISDGGGSITVDGTVNIGTIPEIEIKNDAGNPVPISDAGGSLTVDGTVSVGNAAGAAAVNIQDGGNSITVDGTVAVSSLPSVTIGALPNEGQQTMANSISVALASDQVGVQRTPTFLRPAGLSGTIAAGRYSMSFANVGTIDATVGGITLKPNESISFDAGAINNTLGAVSYNATGAGGELLIISLV